VLAVLVTDIPLASLEGRAAYDYHGNLVLWVAIVLGTGIVVNLVMRRLVTSRLAGVAQALERFGEGQRDLRLPADPPDEIGMLSAAFNQMGQRIQAEETRSRALAAEVQLHVGRQRELLKRLMTAQEEERRRVARDLHDDLGQDLAALAVGLEGADRLCAERPEQARSRLGEMRALIADMTARAYDLILSLRPSVLDDMGLVPALRAHAERVLGRNGIRFDIDAARLTRRMPAEIETAIFRTMQESLSNVVRQSGARQVRVSLATDGGAFEGDVVDDGRGFDVGSVALNGKAPRGVGLLGMLERVALCGGTLEVLSSPGAGTRVRIRIPLSEATHE
jgi:signal transduction histidine kinase